MIDFILCKIRFLWEMYILAMLSVELHQKTIFAELLGGAECVLPPKHAITFFYHE